MTNKSSLPPSQVVVVQAAAGCGKTRLIAELRHMFLEREASRPLPSPSASLSADRLAALQTQLGEAMLARNYDRALDLRDSLLAAARCVLARFASLIRLKTAPAVWRSDVNATARFLSAIGSQLSQSVQYSGWASVLQTLLRARPDDVAADDAASGGAATSPPALGATSDDVSRRGARQATLGWRVRSDAVALLGERAALLNDVLADARPFPISQAIAGLAAQVRPTARRLVNSSLRRCRRCAST